MEKAVSSDVENHSMIAKAFHWGFVVVFIYALTKQVGSVDELADAALLHFEGVFAIAFLILLAIRFLYMQMTRPSALPQDTHPKMRLMAKLGHLAMYASLAMIAISGLAIGAIYSSNGPEGVSMALALGVHEVSVLAAYVTIALHVVAAIYHRLKGDGIWSSMVPVWKERKG